MTAPTVDIRRADDRAKTRIDWLDSKHSFSFGSHYEPDNTHHGLLLVNNDDIVKPGTGFDTHPHRDMEIVTWVLQGSLVHQDSTGHSGVIYPGLAQRMSAGHGILHSEKNDSWTLTGEQSHSEPVHFVQMWVVPDESGVDPGYQQLEIDDELLRGGLVTIASGMPDHSDQTAITIRNKYAALHGARMQAGDSIELPSAPYLHLFVPRGEVTLEGAGALHARRCRAVHRVGRSARHRHRSRRDSGLGDACGFGCSVTELDSASPGWRCSQRARRLPHPTPSHRRQPSTTTPQPAASAKLVAVPVEVGADLAQAPFDQPHQALVPEGWTITVWARVPKARLAIWTPDNRLLVSVPSAGQVLSLATDIRPTPPVDAARRTRPTARVGVPGQDAVRRRKRSDRCLRLRRWARDQSAHDRRRSTRRQKP